MSGPADPKNPADNGAEEPTEPRDFIREIVAADVASSKHGGRVHTRFPPEPNGYLHIGHAKAIHIAWGIAQDFGGKFNLRFDDTNPEKEETEFVEGIQRDVKWLGADWEDRLFHASDYFDTLYGWAQHLIREDLAYVCSLTEEQVREYRGTVIDAGRPSPDRERPAEESLDLMERMKNGEFPEGKYTVRAKIDMGHPNMKMRDPLLYRIKHQAHHRTGDKWHIYPMYDFTHGQSDAIEGITHSTCSLEFQVNRPLYDWFIENLPVPHVPHQYEFARLNLSYTVMSKRKLRLLVEDGHVAGWDDPRMPTLCAMRRRGYTSEAIQEFCARIGVAKADSTVDFSLLEWAVREHLNRVAPRVMAVLRPLKVVITNYPEGQTELVTCVNNPEDEAAGTREVPFTRELWIERNDFQEEAHRKFFRLKPGGEVRLKHAYYITCDEVIKDASGEVVELRCSYDPESKGGSTPDGRKVRGTLHWVSCDHAVTAEVRLYDHLFRSPFPEADGDFLENINPTSLEVIGDAKLEPMLGELSPGERVQFMRNGYFCVDTVDSAPGKPVYNRTATLKDSWTKIESKA